MKSQEDVNVALANGFSFICATCVQLKGKGCIAKSPCAGPLKGMSFPEYLGPLIDGRSSYTEKFCFVCGDTKVKGVVRTADQSMFGVCIKHSTIFTFSAEGQRPPKLRDIRVETIGVECKDGVHKIEEQEKPSQL